MIEPKHPELSVSRQCELLELPRSTYYHRPEPENAENLDLMKAIGRGVSGVSVLREQAD